MNYLLILPLCVLAASKVTVQSSLIKKHIKEPIDAILFNTLIFAVASIFTLAFLFHSVPVRNWLFGSAFGLFSVLFQFFYSFALRYGPVSITVLMVNCSMIIPVCVSAVIFNEPLTAHHIIGIILILATFLLNTEKSEKCSSLKWILFLSFSFISNSGCSIVQKLYAVNSDTPTDSYSFVAIAYFSAALMSLLFSGLLHTKKQYCSFSMSPGICLGAVSIGVILVVFQILNTYTVSVIDGTILFPVYNGGTTLLAICIGCLFFHEKLRKKQILGLITGIAGIVCLCF